MNALGAAITDLFLAFGNATEDRVRAFARMLTTDGRCHVCLEAVCRRAATTAQRMPSVAALLVAYRDQYDEHHHQHLGVSDVEVAVGRAEAWWRTEAVRVIAPHAEDRETASFVAAQMWWSRVVPEDVPDLIRNPMWVDCARTFLAASGDVIDAAWTRARASASIDDERDLPLSIVNLGGTE